MATGRPVTSNARRFAWPVSRDRPTRTRPARAADPLRRARGPPRNRPSHSLAQQQRRGDSSRHQWPALSLHPVRNRRRLCRFSWHSQAKRTLLCYRDEIPHWPAIRRADTVGPRGASVWRLLRHGAECHRSSRSFETCGTWSFGMIVRTGINLRTRFRVLKRDRFKCHYCGSPARKCQLHIDHVLPVSRGGTDDERNLVAACIACNLGKSDSLLDESEVGMGSANTETSAAADFHAEPNVGARPEADSKKSEAEKAASEMLMMLQEGKGPSKSFWSDSR